MLIAADLPFLVLPCGGCLKIVLKAIDDIRYTTAMPSDVANPVERMFARH